MRHLLFFYMTILFADCQTTKTELVGHIGRPDFSPDGNTIVFTYAKDASKDTWEIFSADANGQNAKQLTSLPKARIKKGPVWSPNGKEIAFHADINDGAQIFLMDADGNNLKQLTDMNGYNVEPHWAPNGRDIVFNAIRDDKVQIFIMNKDGSNIRRLYNPNGQNWYPRMTAHNRIIFTSDFKHKDNYEIFTMNPDGSDLRQLTSLKGINWFPEYSPDGSKIAFHSNKDDPNLSDSGDYNLYLMNSDGTDIRKITALKGQELHAKWHPSGTRLIFERHEEKPLGIYTLDLITNDKKKIELFINEKK